MSDRNDIFIEFDGHPRYTMDALTEWPTTERRALVMAREDSHVKILLGKKKVTDIISNATPGGFTVDFITEPAGPKGRCRDCIHWEMAVLDSYKGECRRCAPALDPASKFGKFPSMLASGWCGEFSTGEEKDDE